MRRLLVVAAALVAATAFARADDPGDFDFYVLSLSWSPSYCAEDGRSDDLQCGGRPYAFVVHGFWPQYERGFPEFCDPDAGQVSGATVSSILDLMPSPGLIRHEWRKHGSCSGLDQRDYFDLLREAREHVVIPDRFRNPARDQVVTPREVETAFQEANPELDGNEMAVTCDSRIREVRICLTRDLEFRSCAEVDRRACRSPRALMPRVR